MGGAVARREHCGPAQLSVRGRVSRRTVRIDLVPRRIRQLRKSGAGRCRCRCRCRCRGVRHQNGLDRIEEGVHGPWEQGGAQDIMDTLFLQSSPTLESWEHVRRLRVFDNGTVPAKVQGVMMVTGDSTKMLVPHGCA